MIDEPIHLEMYNPEWQQCFTQERERIQETLCLEDSMMEHIGSTAIPGIQAKPIIDIMIGVKPFPPPQSICDELVQMGYEELGQASVPGRLYFRRRGLESFNVHIVEQAGSHWISNLALRDYLLTHPEVAKQYEAMKIVAIQSTSSLLKYSQIKAPIVEELVTQALAWRAAT